MKQLESQSIGEYDMGSSTTSELEDLQRKPVVKDTEEEEEEKEQKERYASGKPRRIIIRARITHD